MQRGAGIVPQLPHLDPPSSGGEPGNPLPRGPVVEHGRQMRVAAACVSCQHTELVRPEQRGQRIIGQAARDGPARLVSHAASNRPGRRPIPANRARPTRGAPGPRPARELNQRRTGDAQNWLFCPARTQRTCHSHAAHTRQGGNYKTVGLRLMTTCDGRSAGKHRIVWLAPAGPARDSRRPPARAARQGPVWSRPFGPWSRARPSADEFMLASCPRLDGGSSAVSWRCCSSSR